MRIYVDDSLPNHWVVGDLAGKMWIIPAIGHGAWSKRTPYAVPPSMRRARLREVPSTISSIGLGIPDLEHRPVEVVHA